MTERLLISLGADQHDRHTDLYRAEAEQAGRSRAFSKTAVVIITAKSAGREVLGLATAGVRLA